MHITQLQLTIMTTGKQSFNKQQGTDHTVISNFHYNAMHQTEQITQVFNCTQCNIVMLKITALRQNNYSIDLINFTF